MNLSTLRSTRDNLIIKFDPPEYKNNAGIWYGKPIKSNLAVVQNVGPWIKDIKEGDHIMLNISSMAFLNQAIVQEGEEPLPYSCEYTDIFGILPKGGGNLMPLRNNSVVIEDANKEVTDAGILIPHANHRSFRKKTGRVSSTGLEVESITIGDHVMMTKYGGTYFRDTDDIEKVLITENEVLAVILDDKLNIDVGDTKQYLDTSGVDRALGQYGL